MGHLVKSKTQRRQRGRSPVVLFLLLLLWSIVVGWGLAQATEVPRHSEPTSSESIKSSVVRSELAESTSTQNLTLSTQNSVGTVDFIPQRYQLGQELYLENCASCHIGLPPAVLPTQTWRDLLQDSQHYGRQLTLLVDPQRLIVWNYLQAFSRPQTTEEETPYRVGQSRYFKALHPKVKLPQPVTMASCVSCHPGAGTYDFRTLSSEWQNAP